jgi:hypothetical protein
MLVCLFYMIHVIYISETIFSLKIGEDNKDVGYLKKFTFFVKITISYLRIITTNISRPTVGVIKEDETLMI